MKGSPQINDDAGAMAARPSSSIGLAELIASLSLGIDLGFGQPMEHVVRQCWIAVQLAKRLGLSEEERSVVYYTALLTNEERGHAMKIFSLTIELAKTAVALLTQDPPSSLGSLNREPKRNPG